MTSPEQLNSNLRELATCMTEAGHSLSPERLVAMYDANLLQLIGIERNDMIRVIQTMHITTATVTCSSSTYLDQLCLDEGMWLGIEGSFRIAAYQAVITLAIAGTDDDWALMIYDNDPSTVEIIVQPVPQNPKSWVLTNGQVISTSDLINFIEQRAALSKDLMVGGTVSREPRGFFRDDYVQRIFDLTTNRDVTVDITSPRGTDLILQAVPISIVADRLWKDRRLREEAIEWVLDNQSIVE